jgi:hypothetical protein
MPRKHKEPRYEINKEIVFSTGHISLRDMQKLNRFTQHKRLRLNYDSYEYGIRIYVLDASPEADARADGFTPAFINLITIAKEQGCKWLVLDCDGPEFDHLEKFEW